MTLDSRSDASRAVMVRAGLGRAALMRAGVWRTALGLLLLAAAILAGLAFSATPGAAAKPPAEEKAPPPVPIDLTRRAFVVGIQRYSDSYIAKLTRTVDDAKAVAKDLERVGFDPKNIKLFTDLKNRDAFDKAFNDFLKTVQKGDTVVFYFAGHGFGVDASKANYLLFTDLKSPFTFTKSQLPEQDRRNADIVRLRIPGFLDAYAQNEIPNGISELEIERRLAERNPKLVFMVIDACRSLVDQDLITREVKPIKRGPDSGSRLITTQKPPANFMVFYSAAFGENAVESFGTAADNGKNSLFTDVLRSELQRPGQTLVQLGERVKMMVRSIATKNGEQQEPEIIANGVDAEDFEIVGSIGKEHFQLQDSKCAGETVDWNEIRTSQKRDLYERHRRRFDGCPTGEAARQALAQLALSSDDPIEPPAAKSGIDDCDLYAASDQDRSRPPEVPGVLWEKLVPDPAIEACDKAATASPLVARFHYNLGRAYLKKAVTFNKPDEQVERQSALRSARLSYQDAERAGYVSALNDLAALYETDDSTGGSNLQAVELLKRGVQQGDPLAMYNLALHYKNGSNGVARDIGQAAELFARAAESGSVSAMVEYGQVLLKGVRGLDANPRRGMEWLQRAADAGSVRAKASLADTYRKGAIIRIRAASQRDPDRRAFDLAISQRPDADLALLWFARVAETGDSDAQATMAEMTEGGVGLLNPQPEIAARFWRLAAEGGNAYAEFEFADRLRGGFLQVKQEYGMREIVTLLEHAKAQGQPQAALALAQINRTGELGKQRNALEAMKLAYEAMELAEQTDPTTREGNPFYEIAAAQLLVEMARDGEAVNDAGKPVLNEDEIRRLENYYGTVDPLTKRIAIRRLMVPINCTPEQILPNNSLGWDIQRFVWVWDWGRNESPTELQIRAIERETGCLYNDSLRGTLNDIYQQAKKAKVAFADLIEQKVKTVLGQLPPRRSEENERFRGRRR
jgi:TPR repeat protein